MPSDLVAGCLEVVARAIGEVVVQGLGEALWRWCVVVGEFCVFVITLGRVRPTDRFEVISGILGLLIHALVIGGIVTWIISTPNLESGK